MHKYYALNLRLSDVAISTYQALQISRATAERELLGPINCFTTQVTKRLDLQVFAHL